MRPCSLIICTRNRSASLSETLEKISLQNYPHEKLEVLIVDNASDDDTREVVEHYLDNFPFQIKYLYEEQLGLSTTRNRGVAEANGEIVVFLDDDAFPRDNDWLENMVSVFDDPAVSVAGGDLEPVWPEGNRPAWIHDLLLYSLGITQFGLNEQKQLRYPLYPWGANIAFRKQRIEEMNGFPEMLGRQGDRLLSGEESALCMLLDFNGEKVVYAPGAVVKHVIASDRLKESWFVNRAKQQGITDAILEKNYLPLMNFLAEAMRRGGVFLISMFGWTLSRLFGWQKMRLLFHCKFVLSKFYFSTLLAPANSDAL